MQVSGAQEAAKQETSEHWSWNFQTGHCSRHTSREGRPLRPRISKQADSAFGPQMVSGRGEAHWPRGRAGVIVQTLAFTERPG